jgi:1-acyl-sn-glycerol-3-phosphate acyltransferase
MEVWLSLGVAALVVLPPLLTRLISRSEAPPGWRSLVGANMASLLFMGGWWLPPGPVAWAFLKLSLPLATAGVYGGARSSLAAAAAAQSGTPYTRVFGWLETAEAVGLLLGNSLFLQPDTTPAVAALLFGAAVVFAWTASFGNAPIAALESRANIRWLGLGLVGVAGVTYAALAAVVAGAFDGSPDAPTAALSGLASGAFLTSLQSHRFRSLGFLPFAAVGLTGCLVWSASIPESLVACFGVGLTGALAIVPLRARYAAVAPSVVDADSLSGLAAGTLIFLWVFLLRPWLPGGPLPWLALLAGGISIVAGWQLLRPAIEQLTEMVLAPIYRTEGSGPGIAAFPLEGPVLVVCNHTAWLDPLWLGKVLPRRIKPMMTSDFFDKPAIRWLVRDVVHAIRVQASRFRREAPELAEAVAALDAGECLILFPEGHLRKHDRPTVRQFGRGVWHILHDRPTTPVVVCWIEGGFGSFTSYYRGKPATNKRPDFWRPIRVAVATPQVVDPAVLADMRATRRYLMEQCVQARTLLGLPAGTLEEERMGGKEEG